MKISEFVSKFKTSPVLFIGAGISLRYYEGAYSWDTLLKRIASELSGEDYLYWDLKNRCTDSEGECDLAKLALLLSDCIDEKLGGHLGQTLQLNLMEKSINKEFYNSVQSGQKSSRLKIWVKTLLSDLSLQSSKSKEIDLLKDVCTKVVASIVTTNFDQFIEKHLQFSSLIGNDILLTTPYRTVYKIHGCVSDPSSIILTTEDYKTFDCRYSLIQAQLLSLFTHNPIIFLGYNIGDKNIQRLLSTIFSYIKPGSELGKRLTDNFLYVQYEKDSQNIDVVQESLRIQMPDSQIDISLNVLKTDNFEALYEALSVLDLDVTALQPEQIARMFHKGKPSGAVEVQVLGDLENIDNADLILAIGPRSRITISKDKIYSPRDAMLHYFDIVDQGHSGMVVLVENVHKDMFFPARGLSRFFKEMHRSESLCEHQRDNIDKAFEDITKESCRIRGTRTIDDIFEDGTIANTSKLSAIFYGVYTGCISLDDLQNYLQRELCKSRGGGDPSIVGSMKLSTDIRKLLCLYDYKRFES